MGIGFNLDLLLCFSELSHNVAPTAPRRPRARGEGAHGRGRPGPLAAPSAAGRFLALGGVAPTLVPRLDGGDVDGTARLPSEFSVPIDLRDGQRPRVEAASRSSDPRGGGALSRRTMTPLGGGTLSSASRTR